MKESPAVLSLALSLAWSVCVGVAASAQASANVAPIANFDLVTTGIGWAASSTHLYWTVSNGRHWREITPPRVSDDEPIQLVHFIDGRHGWVLLINAIENQPAYLEVQMTSDTGASWRLATVDISNAPIDPAVPPSVDSMSFSDHSHGWILINTSSANIHSAVLVATADAGTHWRVVRSLPLGGSISFSSAFNGVLTASSPAGDAPVWHTRDGGNSWGATNLPEPANCPQCILARVESAHFSSASHAVLTALIKTPGGGDLSSVEYATTDGGATWKLSNSSERTRVDVDRRLTTVVNGHIISIGAAPHNALVLKMNGNKAVIMLPHGLTPGAIDRLSVASNRNAWALFSLPQTNLVSIDPHRKLVKVITPRPAAMKHRPTPRHQRAHNHLLIHCTLVSVRSTSHNQAASNDIIRPNATLRTR